MHIDLKLGLSCNNACIHCVMEPLKKRLLCNRAGIDCSPAEINSVIDRLLAEGMTSITLTGGEPTIRDDFIPLIRRLNQENLPITIQTNGRRLADAFLLSKLEDMARAKIYFVIALHSHDEATHDEITRRKNSFKETMQGIEALGRLGFTLYGKMVLSRKNLRQLKPTIELYKKKSFQEVIVAFPHAQEFEKDVFLSVAPKYSEVKQAIAEIDPDLDIDVFWETMPFCQLPDARYYADSMDLPSLRHKLDGFQNKIEMTMTKQKIDWEQSRGRIKKKPPQCSLCLLERVCEGAWGEYIDIYGDEEFSPIREKALLAPLWERL